jgi:hypothetical protein
MSKVCVPENRAPAEHCTARSYRSCTSFAQPLAANMNMSPRIPFSGYTTGLFHSILATGPSSGASLIAVFCATPQIVSTPQPWVGGEPSSRSAGSRYKLHMFPERARKSPFTNAPRRRAFDHACTTETDKRSHDGREQGKRLCR